MRWTVTNNIIMCKCMHAEDRDIYMTWKFFKAEWFWGRETDNFLRKLCIGKTLNFPCGMSQIGDVRADIDREVMPDVIADLRASEFHFNEGEFETVICDPPFSYWALNKVFSWFPNVCDIASKRLVFRCPLINLNLPKLKSKWKRTYYIVVKSDRLTLNMFHVYTNPNCSLQSYK